MSQVKRVLNVGGHDRRIPLPPQYAGFTQVLLDIDPKMSPDVLCDARELSRLEPGSFDAVYCSHNLEHYYRHDVPKVLSGFLHVLKEDGFAQVIVPDIAEVMRVAVERKLDLEDVLYQSAGGPIMVLDVLWGWSAQIEHTGKEFYAHRTGFTAKSLVAAMQRSGFERTYSTRGRYEINVVAFRRAPDAATRALFGLPDA
jgi:ubiquinone/menaquinone biosynthesis C-methylase UbiE